MDLLDEHLISDQGLARRASARLRTSTSRRNIEVDSLSSRGRSSTRRSRIAPVCRSNSSLCSLATHLVECLSSLSPAFCSSPRWRSPSVPSISKNWAPPPLTALALRHSFPPMWHPRARCPVRDDLVGLSPKTVGRRSINSREKRVFGPDPCCPLSPSRDIAFATKLARRRGR